jgi:hypothetical protein
MLPIREARAQAAACTGTETLQTFSFPAGTWTSGSSGPFVYNVGAGATAAQLTFTATPSVAFSGGTPDQQLHGNLTDTVRHGHTIGGANVLLSTFNVVFNRPVNKLRWIATDVDFITGSWQDRIVSTVNGGTFTTSITAATPGNFTINAATGTATATGSNNCASTSAACNVTNNFNLVGITTGAMQFRTGPSHRTRFHGVFHSSRVSTRLSAAP